MSQSPSRLLVVFALLLVSCSEAAQVATTTPEAVTSTQTTTTTTQPTTTTTTQPTTTTTIAEQAEGGGSGEEALTFNGWATRLDENGCPVEPVEGYSSGTTQMLADFLYEGMTDGQQVYYQWNLNGAVTFSETIQWTFGPAGNCLWFNLSDPGGLPDGAYALDIFTGTGPEGRAIGSASTSLGGAAEPAGDGITFEGRIVDLDTGLGVPGALFCVLKLPEGMTSDQAIENFFATRDMELVAAFTRTDDQGFYRLAGLARASQYPVVVEAPGYEVVAGTVELASDAPQVGTVELDDIAMVRP